MADWDRRTWPGTVSSLYGSYHQVGERNLDGLRGLGLEAQLEYDELLGEDELIRLDIFCQGLPIEDRTNERFVLLVYQALDLLLVLDQHIYEP